MFRFSFRAGCPATAGDVHEAGVARRAVTSVGDQVALGDRFPGADKPLFPLVWAVRLVVGVQEVRPKTASRTSKADRDARVFYAVVSGPLARRVAPAALITLRMQTPRPPSPVGSPWPPDDERDPAISSYIAGALPTYRCDSSVAVVGGGAHESVRRVRLCGVEDGHLRVHIGLGGEELRLSDMDRGSAGAQPRPGPDAPVRLLVNDGGVNEKVLPIYQGAPFDDVCACEGSSAAHRYGEHQMVLCLARAPTGS